MGWKARLILGGRTVFFFIDLSFSDTDVVVTKCFLFKFIKVSRINKLLSIFSNSALIDESSLNFARLRLACVMVGGQEVTESKGVGAMWNVSPSYGAS